MRRQLADHLVIEALEAALAAAPGGPAAAREAALTPWHRHLPPTARLYGLVLTDDGPLWTAVLSSGAESVPVPPQREDVTRHLGRLWNRPCPVEPVDATALTARPQTLSAPRETGAGHTLIPLVETLPGGQASPSGPAHLVLGAIVLELPAPADRPPGALLEALTRLGRLLAPLLAQRRVRGRGLHPRGLLNRRGLRATLEDWISQFGPLKVEAALLLAGLDNILEVNRQCGYEEGTRAVTWGTEILVDAFPADALGARYGGAMVAALLTGHTAERAPELAREIAASCTPKLVYRGIALTPRIGLVQWSELTAAMGEPTAIHVVVAAEQALTAARHRSESVVLWRSGDPADLESLPIRAEMATLDGSNYRRLLTMWRLFEALSESTQFDDLLQRTLAALVPLFLADEARLWMRHEGRHWEIASGVDRRGQVLDRSAGMDPPAWVAALAEAERPLYHMLPEGTSLLVAPLRVEGRLLGVIELKGLPQHLEGSKRQLTFLGSLAGRIASALGQARTLEAATRHQREREERLRREKEQLEHLLSNRPTLVGADPVMLDLIDRVRRVAPSRATVLIHGETGTGKEAVARMLHELSGRQGPFVIVDCGALPATLLESELFGYERGAFTGADRRKVGRLEEAHGGTLFLDEIGELPLELQPKLLRLLQEGTMRRLGGLRDLDIDIRVVAATHRSLPDMVASGRFRADLYYRLGVIELGIPPLRQRGDDVLLLAAHFLHRYA